MTQGKRRTRGFGLIEVMISASLLAVGMSATMSLLANLEDNYKHQRLVAQALHLGESGLEDLLVRYADDSELKGGTHPGPSFGLDGSPGGTFFVTSWVVEEGTPFAGARQITIKVTWIERDNVREVTRQLKLTTVRT